MFTYSLGVRKRNSLLLDHFYLLKDKIEGIMKYCFRNN